MANLRDKFKDLENIGGKTDIGGAPFHGDDFVKVQENTKANFINNKERLRSRLGTMGYYRGSGNPIEQLHSFGLVLAGLEYNNADPANPVISEGYFLSEGEVIYYPGGTFNTGGVTPKMLYLRKGTKTTESRNFDDGVSKVFASNYAAEVFTSDFNNFGPINEPIASADLSKEYIVMPIGGGPYYTYVNFLENNCTEDKTLNLINLEKRVSYTAFSDATLQGSWALNSDYLNKMASSVDERGFTYITGSVKKTFTGGSTTDQVATLTSENLSFSQPIPLEASFYDVAASDWVINFKVIVNSIGLISVKPIGGGSFPTGELIIYFNNVIAGTSSILSKTYTYNNSFMDITP